MYAMEAYNGPCGYHGVLTKEQIIDHIKYPDLINDRPLPGLHLESNDQPLVSSVQERALEGKSLEQAGWRQAT